MNNPYKNFLTRRINELLLEATLLTGNAARMAHAAAQKRDSWGNIIGGNKKNKEKTMSAPFDPSLPKISKGNAGFIHSDTIGAVLSTAVLTRQRSSGQKDFLDSAVKEITAKDPSGPHQMKIYFGEKGKGRKPFELKADTDAPRSSTDTLRYSFGTKHAAVNNNRGGLKEDGALTTHVWHENGWKSMTHDLEYAQGNKQLLRAYVSTGTRKRKTDEQRGFKRQQLDVLKQKNIKGKTTWGTVIEALGQDNAKKLFNHDTHIVNHDLNLGTFSAVKIGDIHPDTPIYVGSEKRNVAQKGKVLQPRAGTEDIPTIEIRTKEFMEFNASKGIGTHRRTADQFLEHFANLHSKNIESSKKEIKEWVYSSLLNRGIVIS